MRRYETIVIVKPGIGDAEFAVVSGKVTDTIESFGGTVLKNDRWGLRKLAYSIGKDTQGDYLFVEYAGVPDGVKEMERLLRIDDRALKFLTVKTQDVFVADAPKPTEAEAPASEEAGEEVSE